MYRLLILTCFVAWTAGQCGPEDRGRDWIWPGGNGEDDDYNDMGSGGRRNLGLSVANIARKLKSAGELMGTFCKAHSDRNLREVYGVEHFKLTVMLAEFSANNIKVKVYNRLVFIHAQDCESKYAAVRLLPDVVDASEGTWSLKGGVLTVLFPYNITPNSNLQSRCGHKANTGVIAVPQSSADSPSQPDYELVIGDPEFRRALKRYLQQQGNMGQGGSLEDEGTNEYVDDH